GRGEAGHARLPVARLGLGRGGGGLMSETRAERMRVPLAADVIRATAEKHGVCVRPFTMEVGDTSTGELRYVPVPCGSTVESVCRPGARKAKALRQAQCGEGCKMTEEPNLTPGPPTEDQKELLTYRADREEHTSELQSPY